MVDKKIKCDNKEIKAMISASLSGAFKTVDSFVHDLIDNKKQLFTINGEFNDNLIDEFFRDLCKNEENAFEKIFLDKIKEEVVKRIKEEKRRKKDN